MFLWLQVVYLTWWPLFRDATYYTLTVVALIVVIFDEEVYWSIQLPTLLHFLVFFTILSPAENCLGQH